jgi:LacI family transcriptional regulator
VVVKAPTPVTVVDVARLAGVSTATAGRALGGYGSVKPSTLLKVQAAADELGYSPNAIAKSMITGRTLTLGAVVADIENPFFARVIRGIADVARARGFEVVLSNTDEELATEQATVKLLVDKRVDGLIVAPASGSDSDHLVAAMKAGSHLVLVDRTVRGLQADTITIRNRAAASHAVSYLAELGHTRIGYVSGTMRTNEDAVSGSPTRDVSTGEERIAGYRRALRESGLHDDGRYIEVGGPRKADAGLSASKLLGMADPPTAIVAADSVIALGILEEIHRRGLRIPEDVSVVGFDDAEWASVVTPPLSVIQQPAYELGAGAASLLIDRILGLDGPPRNKLLESVFIDRGSVARLAGG